MNALWAQRNSRERLLIIACVLIVGVAIYTSLPGGADSKKLLPAAEATKTYKETVAKKNVMEQETARLKPEIAKMVFTESPDELIPKIVKTLQTIARESGVHLREIKPIRPKRVSGVTKVPVTVRFSTSNFNHGAVGFLYRAEDPKVRLVVDKMNVVATDIKTRIVDVEVQLAGYTQSIIPGDKGSS